jgi:hypothetical protein
MAIRLGIAPIGWTNDDLPALGGDVPLEQCLKEAQRLVKDPNMYGSLMVREGAADALLGGLTTHYPNTIRPALQVLKVEEGRSIVSSVYVVVVDGRRHAANPRRRALDSGGHAFDPVHEFLENWLQLGVIDCSSDAKAS